MNIYLDSALLAEAVLVREWGWVRGVTTNPSLMAQAGQPAESVLEGLAGLGFEEVFYQLIAQDWDGMLLEAKAAREIVGSALVLKLPPSSLGFRFAAQHVKQYNSCVTAIFDPSQALTARAAGVKYIAVYVNRAVRLLENGAQLVESVSNVLKGSKTEIIAASLKTPAEAASAAANGAHHITLPFAILEGMPIHPLSQETMQRFSEEGTGLKTAGHKGQQAVVRH